MIVIMLAMVVMQWLHMANGGNVDGIDHMDVKLFKVYVE